MITSDESYLQTYRTAATEIDSNVTRFEQLTADNPVQQERIPRLKKIIAERLETMNAGESIRRQNGLDALLHSELPARGKVQSEAFRQIIADMQAEENRLLGLRREEVRTSGRRALLTFALANLLLIALFLAVYYLIIRDYRLRRQSEDQLRAANDLLENRIAARTVELTKINIELGRSNRELQDFAFVASHDLQEPLRKIQAFGDRLKIKYSERLGDEGCNYLERMQNAARRMQTLINELLTFSRVTTKAQPFMPVNLETIAHEVLNDLETRIQQTSGAVELGSLPIIEADALQMRQLLQNLIGNALKFHRREVSPIVKVRGEVITENVFATASKSIIAESCRLMIKDNGIGFEEKYLDRIFTPFQRLHARSEFEGTGMGLAVCRKIVERHGGSITARSIPGSGTTFIVTLPVRQH